MPKTCRIVWMLVAACVGVSLGPAVGRTVASMDDVAEEAPTAPSVSGGLTVEPSPMVDRVLGDALTSEAERLRLRVRHGRWEGLEAAELPAALRARWAWLRGDLDAAVWDNAEVPPLLVARAAAMRRDAEAARAAVEAARRAEGAAVEARSRELLGALLLERGQTDAALEMLLPLRGWVSSTPARDAGELVAAARGLALLARLEGTPSRDHHTALRLLAEARELDPLSIDARLAEAELLMGKGNRQQAHEAITEALPLNPRSGRGWALLGRLAAESYNFDLAREAQAQLDALNADHVFAHELRLLTLLRQRDTDAAMALVAEHDAAGRFAKHARMQGLCAAAEGMAYRESAMRGRLNRFDSAVGEGHAGATPRPATPWYVAGQSMSFARQYAVSESLLREAIDREANWAEPHVALGLNLMQEGDLPAAEAALSRAVRLDPFHVGASNQHRLAEEMNARYVTYETERFVIRCEPGIDEVLALDMVRGLDAMHAEVAAAFDHTPPNRTQIDLLPDENRFAVRITGMPDLWTIAAATGDVVALTPPRSGRRQHGTFDWLEVLRHEYTHTVTLSRTGNRIPHWFTEACAVWQEPSPRSYSRCRMLADALHDDTLFALDEINWGFIRPEKPEDRALAYAQAEWMLEYLLETHGHDAMIALLERHAEGVPNVRAIETVTGVSAESFLSSFRAWATKEVEAWGLGPSPILEDVQRVAAIRDGEARGTEIDALLSEYGDAPPLLRLACEHFVASGESERARALLTRYAQAVPVDPYPHVELVKLAEARGELASAAESLAYLDRRELDHGRWASLLARHHREAGDLDAAMRFAERALQREPYHPRYREFAATVALQRGDLETALHHLEAMPRLEPDVELHERRLDALRQKMALR